MSVIVLASEKAALELLSLTLMARVIRASDESMRSMSILFFSLIFSSLKPLSAHLSNSECYTNGGKVSI